MLYLFSSLKNKEDTAHFCQLSSLTLSRFWRLPDSLNFKKMQWLSSPGTAPVCLQGCCQPITKASTKPEMWLQSDGGAFGTCSYFSFVSSDFQGLVTKKKKGKEKQYYFKTRWSLRHPIDFICSSSIVPIKFYLSSHFHIYPENI